MSYQKTFSRNQLESAVIPVVGDSPLFISDNDTITDWLTKAGFQTLSLTEAIQSSSSSGMVFIRTKFEGPSKNDFKEWLPEAKILMLPLMSFDASENAAFYNIELLAQCDFIQSCNANRQWLDRLRQRREGFRITSYGTSGLEWHLSQHLKIMPPRITPQLKPGEVESIAAFFEVGLIRDERTLGCSVIGSIDVPFISVARNRTMSRDNELPEKAWKWISSLWEKNGRLFRVELEGDQISKIYSGSQNLTQGFQDLTEQSELVLVEASIGTNNGLRVDHLNFTINSQLHEGLAGFHFGIGDGVTVPHIDFICPGVEFF